MNKKLLIFYSLSFIFLVILTKFNIQKISDISFMLSLFFFILYLSKSVVKSGFFDIFQSQMQQYFRKKNGDGSEERPLLSELFPQKRFSFTLVSGAFFLAISLLCYVLLKIQ